MLDWVSDELKQNSILVAKMIQTNPTNVLDAHPDLHKEKFIILEVIKNSKMNTSSQT